MVLKSWKTLGDLTVVYFGSEIIWGVFNPETFFHVFNAPENTRIFHKIDPSKKIFVEETFRSSDPTIMYYLNSKSKRFQRFCNRVSFLLHFKSYLIPTIQNFKEIYRNSIKFGEPLTVQAKPKRATETSSIHTNKSPPNSTGINIQYFSKPWII